VKHFSAVFHPDLTAPAAVRHEVRDCLSAWEANPLTGDATLLSTELITGALLDSSGVVRFDAVFDGTRLTLSVRSARRSLASANSRFPTPSRLGLVLIERLADRWGIDDEPEGIRVWCELDGVERAGRRSTDID